MNSTAGPDPERMLAGARAAQMNGRRQVLFLHKSCFRNMIARQDVRNMDVQIGRSELDRVTRNDTEVEAVEPA